MEKKTETFPVIDGHVDLVYEMIRNHKGIPFPELKDSPVTLEKMESGDVRVITVALYCPDTYNGADTAPAFLDILFQYLDGYLEGLMPIKSVGDLESCYSQSSGAGALLLLENADALLNFDLDRLKARSLRVVGLTHAGRNRVGDGNGVAWPEHLSKEGRELVRRLSEEGFAIDVAHLSDPCFWDLMRIFDGPILSSHTGFRFFCDKPRNLEREQIRVIIERGGLLGVTVNPEMLSLNEVAGIDEVYKHIDWVAQKYGPDHVALGSDFCGFDVMNEGIPDISSYPALSGVLREHGYPSDAIAAIMGGNWYRFYSALLSSI